MLIKNNSIYNDKNSNFLLKGYLKKVTLSEKEKKLISYYTFIIQVDLLRISSLGFSDVII